MSLSRRVGRYLLHEPLASGGMATVHLGRILGVSGFARTVAIKRLREEHAGSAELMTMLLDEAHIAARIRHPNVVPTLDAFTDDGEIFVVMEYVLGVSLQELVVADQAPMPIPIAVRIVSDVLAGLTAAHETRSAEGELLDVVHRDVSPHNVVIGVDGSARVLDFGIAKARGRFQTTRDGQLKGKLAFMAPEQTRGGAVSPATDVFAVGIVLFELVTGEKLFRGDNEAHTLANVLHKQVPSPASLRSETPATLDRAILRALERDPASRYATAREMAEALDVHPMASRAELVAWTEARCRPLLDARRARLRALESAPAADAVATTSAIASADVETRIDVTASPSVAAPASPWRRAAAIASVVAVAGLVAAVVFAARDGAPAAPTSVVVAPGASPSTTGAATSIPTNEAVVSGASPSAVAAVVTFTVKVTPPGSTVTFDGAPLGVAPIERTIPRSVDEHELRVEARGYAPWTTHVAADRDRDFVLTLTPAGRARPPPTAPAEPEVRRFD